MDQQDLPRTMRLRVIVVAVSAGLLALLMLPLEIISVTSGRGDAGMAAAVFSSGIGLPVLFGLLMWWQVRRYRRNPDVRRRQPNPAAARVLTLGSVVVVLLGTLTRVVSGVGGWPGWVINLCAILIGSFVVVHIARRHDPRIHYFRRPDPLPEEDQPRDDSSQTADSRSKP